jgi:hypothetical protein
MIKSDKHQVDKQTVRLRIFRVVVLALLVVVVAANSQNVQVACLMVHVLHQGVIPAIDTNEWNI